MVRLHSERWLPLLALTSTLIIGGCGSDDPASLPNGGMVTGGSTGTAVGTNGGATGSGGTNGGATGGGATTGASSTNSTGGGSTASDGGATSTGSDGGDASAANTGRGPDATTGATRDARADTSIASATSGSTTGGSTGARLDGAVMSDALADRQSTASTCGNGTVDPGEQCDDGNTKDFDGCSSDCRDSRECEACEADMDRGCPDNTDITTDAGAQVYVGPCAASGYVGSDATNCEAVYACGVRTGCAIGGRLADCYCGSADACSAMTPNGPCKKEIERGLKDVDTSSIAAVVGNLNRTLTPTGAAGSLLFCDYAQCRAECLRTGVTPGGDSGDAASSTGGGSSTTSSSGGSTGGTQTSASTGSTSSSTATTGAPADGGTVDP